MSWPEDPVAAVTHPDPYPYYASLASQPMGRHPRLGCLVAARTADVMEVLASDLLRVRPPAEPVPRAIAGSAAGDVFGRLVRMTDGPRQADGKRAVSEALASVDPRAVRSGAQARAAGLAASLDLVRRPWRAMEVAWQVPVRTMADLLGLAPDDGEAAAGRTRALVGGFAPGATTEDAIASASAAAFLRGALGRAGLHGALARAAQTGGLDAAFVAANAVGFLSQALEATAGLVGNALVALAREPDLRALPPETLVRAVMRHDPPVQNTRRFAAAAGTVAGARFAEGDAILVVLAVAGGFGHGRHACPGDALAEALAAGCVEALMEAGLDPAALRDRVGYRPSPNVRIPAFTEGGRP
jgi:cytochrome P450